MVNESIITHFSTSEKTKVIIRTNVVHWLLIISFLFQHSSI
jgi:hypothetical protein